MIFSDWQSQIVEKKIWRPEFSFFYCHFIKFGLLVFLEIAYNNSLEQFLTPARSKIYEKIFWGPNLGQRGQNRAWNFFVIFSWNYLQW